jgi:hypothetical protein
MTSHEPPKRSDFAQASQKPDCGAHCEHDHGEMGYTDEELEIFRLRARVKELEEQVDMLSASLDAWESRDC